MCGIAGAISKIDISSDRINQTLGLMKNRGPDGTRSEVITVSYTHLTLPTKA